MPCSAPSAIGARTYAGWCASSPRAASISPARSPAGYPWNGSTRACGGSSRRSTTPCASWCARSSVRDRHPAELRGRLAPVEEGCDLVGLEVVERLVAQPDLAGLAGIALHVVLAARRTVQPRR